MKKQSFFSKVTVYVLTLCMLVSGLWGANLTSASAAGSTTVYFLNSEGWTEVYGYVYASGTTVGTGWPGDAAEAAPEVGDNWWKMAVAREASTEPFNIIFNNNSGSQVDAYITSDSNNYMTFAGSVYDTSAEAEEAMGAGSAGEDEGTGSVTDGATVYYYNANGWSQVYAYVYANNATVGTEWPGVAAEAASEIGDDWWKVTVARDAAAEPFNIIYNNNSGTQVEAYISQNDSNYMGADGTLYTTQEEAEAAGGQEAVTGSTTVYFLNSGNWDTIGAYVYGVGEALGPWPGVTPDAADELGELWYKVEVPAVPKFNIIFFNTAAGSERAELQIPSESHIYVTGANQVFGSQLEAELSQGMGDLSQATTVYFYNSRGWESVNGYTYAETADSATTIGASWPGSAAEEAPEIGENWWKVMVPRLASESDTFKIIFNDGMNQTDDVEIKDQAYVYVTAAAGLYDSAAAAEEAAANDDYDDGSDAGPNTDLENYVTLEGAGANLPYITYEAEDAATNASVLEADTTYRESIQSETSGRQAVKLENTGDYVEFTLTEDANAFVIRYSMPDSEDGTGIDGTLSLLVNGTEAQDLALTSRYAWVYGSYPYTNTPSQGLPHRFFDETRGFFGETLPAGTTVRLEKTDADTAGYYIIDFIECELVEDALTQPDNSLSVLDFGAVANDGQDDYDAFVACIEAAAAEGKIVWIPAGTFDLAEEVALDVKDVTIQGAGMWHTNLAGAGVSFHYAGTCKFYDFAMTGVSTVRDDSGDLAGFEGIGKSTNVTIENIWMEHIKVGVWNINGTNLVIQGCRIRNTYADGINLCSGTKNATVRNNSVRNTGDDGIAIWPWQADCTDNTIAYNTIQVPTLANGVAIYGGNGNVAEYNHVSDIINNGAGICVGSEFATKKGFSGTATVRHNELERCGSYQTDKNYPIGAIWIWSSSSPMEADFDINCNVMYNSSYEGILIDGGNKVSGLLLNRNEIYGATDAIMVRGGGEGAAEILCTTIEDITGEVLNNDNASFTVTGNIDHEIGETYQSDADGHWKACSACGLKSALEAHAFGDWTVVTEATATENGVKERTCTVCGHKETAEMEPSVEGEDGPSTGDNELFLWGILLSAAGLGAISMLAAMKKKKVQ